MYLPRHVLSRGRLVIGSAAVVVLATVGSGITLAPRATVSAAPGTHTASVAVQPKLTTNTNAPCNAPQPKGHARCLAVVRTPADHVLTPDDAGPPSTALTPAELRAAYKLSAGGGQTVATVIWGDDPSAESDLAVFRSQYGLPPCTTANGCFRKINQTGQQGNYPSNQGTAIETSLDVDAISAACPGCNILIVEASSNSTQDLGASVDEAVSLGARFISNSYGDPGEVGESQADNNFYDHPGVVVTVSSGDFGDIVQFPSSDPNVVAVGGTTLTQDASVSRGWDEKAWGDGVTGDTGGGSGCSSFEPQPSFQGNIPLLDAACPNDRATADISADADPASGIAVYDTNADCEAVACNWVQVGGTSLSAPLVASMYALAGTPAAGTFPVTYPYSDPNDLNDVTTGVNGNCGNVLCTAGPGWDGPTGLGTPDGVQALQAAPQGTITGQVTDASTGKPVAGARVTVSPGSEATTTDTNGDYTLSGLVAGTYALTFSDFEYQTATQSGVQVQANRTTTANIALTELATTTVSGTVTDGSGQGWPLYAEITIDGYAGGPIFTDPATGKYRVTLPSGSRTLHVTPVYGSYQTATQTVQMDQPNQVVNVTPKVDETSCTAPGYGWNGLSTDFLGWSSGTAQEGWSVTGSRNGWRFDDPGNRNQPPGGDDNFAVADSAWAGHQQISTTLTTPAVDLSDQAAPTVSFDSRYLGASGQSASVQVSADNGRHWSILWHSTGNSTIGTVNLPLPAKSGQVRVRFSFTGRDGGYWEIDNVFVGTRSCVPQPGGLIIGDATDAGTGADLPGVTIARTADAGHPAITIATLGDPNTGDGFYWLFAPPGSIPLTASDEGYATARRTVQVTAGQVATSNWALTAKDRG